MTPDINITNFFLQKKWVRWKYFRHLVTKKLFILDL